MMTFKRKIAIAIASILVVSLTTITTISVWDGFTTTSNTLTTTLSSSSDSITRQIAMELEYYSSAAYEIGCVSRFSSSTLTTDEKIELLGTKISHYGFLRGDLIGADGKSITNGNDYNDRAWYQATLKGETYITEPLIGKSTGTIATIIAAPIWEGGVENSKIVGAVYLVPQTEYLNDVLRKLSFSENSYAFVIGANGTVISSENSDDVAAMTTISAIQGESLSTVETAMLSGKIGNVGYSLNGKNYQCFYSPIDGTNGWTLGIAICMDDFMSATYRMMIFLVILSVVFLAVALVITYRLATKIGSNIGTCVKRLEQLTYGDFTSPVPSINSNDETKLLAECTAHIVNTLRNINSEINDNLGEMAKGNFIQNSNGGACFIGDYQSIYRSMEQLKSDLSETLAKISDVANQVDANAAQVSDGASSLSEGTTRQASSIEELAATISEVSDHVKENAESAQEASNMVNQVGSEILTSNDKMQDMIGAMTDISNSSEEIEKIIKSIEDIAFQTNILALNAAVEAARAGEAGKGFAVVADEVRSLASKSAEAAKNTNALIGNSIAAIERGTHIANDTAKSLVEVVNNTQNVICAIDEISTATEKQSSAIEQIAVGVDQISGVIQTNSATAQQSAAAAEELSAQSGAMKDIVQNFKF